MDSASPKAEEFEFSEKLVSVLHDFDGEQSLFFSLTIDPAKQTTLEQPQITDSIIHITNACFGEKLKPNSRTVVVCQITDTQQMPICVLNKNHQNQSLDLLFNETVKFVLRGKSPSAVTLTGYYQPSIFNDDIALDAELEDKLNNAELQDYMSKQNALEMDSSSSEEGQAKRAMDDVEVVDEDEKQADIMSSPPIKKRKVANGSTENISEKIKVSNVEEEVSAPSDVKDKAEVENKKKKKKKINKKMKKMKNGIQWRDMKKGTGDAAKVGNKLSVFYVGQLENAVVFDKCITEKGFEFVLGAKEVIQGWNFGIKGMKVGTKRRLIIPAKLAYGKKGQLPTIPPNSNLTFTIELRSID